MMDKIIIRTIKSHARPIWRCGRQFDRDGQTVSPDDFSTEELKRVMADPALEGIDPDTDEVLFTGGKSAELPDAPEDPAGPDKGKDRGNVEDEDLRQRLRDAITGLAPGDFTKGGEPDVKALKAALPGDAEKINAALRDAVWEALIDEGFKAPEKPD